MISFAEDEDNRHLRRFGPLANSPDAIRCSCRAPLSFGNGGRQFRTFQIGRRADLRIWLETTHRRVSRRSELAGAIGYALARWDALTLALQDGHACIDNSAAERAMRPVAVGRRNWTFAGSDAGGERAAAIYSVIETAKLQGLDPEAYLRRVIERIADHPVNRVSELLPWNLPDIRPRLDQRRAA